MKIKEYIRNIIRYIKKVSFNFIAAIRRWGRRKGIKKLVLFLAFTATALLLGLVMFVWLVSRGTFGELPADQELLSIHHPQASEVYSVDSVLMGRYFIQNRLDLRKGELTEEIRSALISTEDIRFYEHNGIDLRSLARVLVKTILLNDVSSGGGSTLTQQLAKNLYPRRDYRWLSLPVNKIREMLIARKLEKLYSKDEILELYLNTVPFGEDTYGIRTAAKLYFDKSPSELKTEEAALLVGMLKATSYYDPKKNPEQARHRRNVVLSQLNAYGYLSDEKADSLMELPLDLNYSSLPYYAGIAPYFREYLRQELDEWCSNNTRENGKPYNLYTDGLKIYTSIHSTMQKYAEEAVREHMMKLQDEFEREWHDRDLWKNLKQKENQFILTKAEVEDGNDSLTKIMKVFSWDGEKERVMTRMDSVKYFMRFLQSGFLAMDVESRQVRAWVGGIDFKYFKYDHVLSKRQVGSVFKPIVYLTALENGIEPCDFYDNDSIVYDEYEGWSPRNADRKYGGEYSVKGALAHSVNTVSAALIIETGTVEVVDLAHKMGVESELPYVPSLALGTAAVSLYEMVNVYSTLASGGIKAEPVYLLNISDADGEILYENTNVGSRRVIPERDAKVLTAMLQNVVNRGTGAALRYKYNIPGEVAGKTGTTQNHSDGWFIGYTPELVAGVWVGGELPSIRFRSSKFGQGASSAMPVFAGFFQKVYNDTLFEDLQNSSFHINQDIYEMLECDDFREEREPVMENLWDRLRNLRIFRKRE